MVSGLSERNPGLCLFLEIACLAEFEPTASASAGQFTSIATRFFRRNLNQKWEVWAYLLRIQSAARSPIMMVVALVLARMTLGIIEASATMIFSKP